MREEKNKNERLGMVLLVIAALCIVTSVYLFTSNKKEPYIPPVEEKKITNEEAVGIANEIIQSILIIYENPKASFNSKEEADGRILVRNYDEVIGGLFSVNGKLELEQVKFNDKNFVEKKEAGTYILVDIPEDKIYSTWQMTTKNYYITKNNIELEVTFGKSIINDDKEMTISSMTINMKLVNIDRKWLVDSFNYNNL